MAYSTVYECEMHIVVTVFCDETLYADFIASLQQAAPMIQEKQDCCVLFDFANSTIDMSTLDIVSIPDLFQSVGVKRTQRCALVSGDSKVNREAADFLQMVSRNRGWLVEVFDSRESANVWLTKGPGSSSR